MAGEKSKSQDTGTPKLLMVFYPNQNGTPLDNFKQWGIAIRFVV